MTRPSEDRIISQYFAPWAGPGALGLRDDAALATPRAGHDLVVTKDVLVAGVHFFADDPPDAIARKALRVNLSDLAAKGARPTGFLLGLALPTHWTAGWLDAFAEGLAADAQAYAVPILGGDTVATPGPLTVSITAFGEVAAGRMVPRAGAKPGDLIYVSGTIGDAALGLAIRYSAESDGGWIERLDVDHREALLGRYLLPCPRLELAPALACARTAIDVSDGFLGDLEKMLRLAGLTTRIDVSNLPLSDAVRAAIALDTRCLVTVLTGGDDYEIVCTVAPERVHDFEREALMTGVDLSCVGVATPGDTLQVVDESGNPLGVIRKRFEHFT